MTFSEDELLRALQEAAEMPDDADGEARTVWELVDALGVDDRRVRRWLGTLKAQDKVECVKVRRLRLDNQVAWVPAYRLKAGE